jgi:hypothetical protein
MRYLLLAAALVLTGCVLPKDPERTTERVRGGELVVGVLTDALSTPDRRVIEALAARLGARAAPRTGPAHLLLALLEEGEVHLLAGDIPADTPLAARAGLSNGAGRLHLPDGGVEDRVLLIRAGENRFLAELNQAIDAAGVTP